MSNKMIPTSLLVGKHAGGMEAMIENANSVLDRACSAKPKNAIPHELFEKAKGVAIMSSIEVAVGFSGTYGKGIIIVKDEKGIWSPPSAGTLHGVGFGLQVGASSKDIVIFLFDDLAMDTMAGEAGVRIGVQAELTALRAFGRGASITANCSNTGIGSTFALAHTKGLFVGLSIEGAVLRCNAEVNAAFYGTSVSASQILFENVVQLPEDVSLSQLYDKLDSLAKLLPKTPEDDAVSAS
jgi:lipid-binding SYLF domain-containing protein